ncbi:helix-turn-helix domain-containing protein [Klebsiella quasipneumoniae subsp. similipneumoniae]
MSVAKLRPLDTSGRQRRYAEIISSQEGGCGKNWISNRYAFLCALPLGQCFPAADALDISQPTGSLLLKKLRDHFADPLFVRVGQRMIRRRERTRSPPPSRLFSSLSITI